MKKSTLHPVRGSRKGRCAFTLVEMLVVVGIIAVLVTIVVGVSQIVIARAAVERTRVNMQVILQAIEAYRESEGAYPSATSNLFVLLKGNTAAAKKLASLPGDAIKDVGSGDCFVDGFGQPLDYSPDDGAGGTPLLESAGADGDPDPPNTADNIRSDGQ